MADNRSQGKSHHKGDSLTYELMAEDYAALLNKPRTKEVDNFNTQR